MYTYKVIEIKHSFWTGKAALNVEDTINGFAMQGWRLIQVINVPQNHTSIKLFFEKKVGEDKPSERDLHYSGSDLV